MGKWVADFKAHWVERLKPPESGRVEYRDSTLPGLVLRVHASDSKTWYVVYRVRGRKELKRLRLGLWPAMTLAAARESAGRILLDARTGADEAEARKRERQAPTLIEVAEEFLDRYARVRRKTWKVDEQRIRKYLPELGQQRAKDVKRSDVVKLLETIAATAPVQANRVLGLIRRIYSWGQSVDLVDRNPCVGIEPPGAERPRERRLDDDEIRTIWQACESLRGAGKDAARLVLLTAQRGGEVLSMAWADLDLEGAWWTLPAEKTKAGREHRVPLSAPAVEILRGRQAGARSSWVFPGRDGGHVEKLRRGVQTLRGLTDVTDFRGHDLRRTAATKLGELGAAPHIISRILNHAEGGVTSIYNRHQYDTEKREALDRWAARLMEIVGGGNSVSDSTQETP